MKPILGELEEKTAINLTTQTSPLEELTCLDRIDKSKLIQPGLVLNGTTRVTQVVRETTDDR
jgi:hypothetical protein